MNVLIVGLSKDEIAHLETAAKRLETPPFVGYMTRGDTDRGVSLSQHREHALAITKNVVGWLSEWDLVVVTAAMRGQVETERMFVCSSAQFMVTNGSLHDQAAAEQQVQLICERLARSATIATATP